MALPTLCHFRIFAVNTCSTTPALASGTVGFSDSDDHASIATFACSSGYTQSGDTTVTCDATADRTAWPSATAVCTGDYLVPP